MFGLIVDWGGQEPLKLFGELITIPRGPIARLVGPDAVDNQSPINDCPSFAYREEGLLT
jgi:hypothetical protein